MSNYNWCPCPHSPLPPHKNTCTKSACVCNIWGHMPVLYYIILIYSFVLYLTSVCKNSWVCLKNVFLPSYMGTKLKVSWLTSGSSLLFCFFLVTVIAGAQLVHPLCAGYHVRASPGLLVSPHNSPAKYYPYCTHEKTKDWGVTEVVKAILAPAMVMKPGMEAMGARLQNLHFV